MKKTYLYLTFLLSLLIIATAIYGLTFDGAYYLETANWTAQVIAQDIVNLIIGVPVLVVSALLANKSKKAYLFWMGTLLFILYSFVIYAFNIHYNHMFLIYTSIILLSTYMLMFSLYNFDYKGFKASFDNKFTGIGMSRLLKTTGILFYLMWLSSAFNYLFKGILPPDLELAGLITNPVHILDLALFLPAMIISSELLKKKHLLGYVIPFVILITMILLSINIIAINIVVEFRGLGEARILSFVFIIIMSIYTYFLANGLNNIKETNK